MRKKPRASKVSTSSRRSTFGIYDRFVIPVKYQDVSAVLILLVVHLVFLSPVFFKGKSIDSSDRLAPTMSSNAREVAEDGSSYWQRHIFGGTPTASSIGGAIARDQDILSATLNRLFHFGGNFGKEDIRLSTYWLFFSFGIYFLMRVKLFTPFQATISALGAVFCTSMLEWLMAWHSTKMGTLIGIPFLLAFLEKVRMSRTWIQILFGLLGLIVSMWLMTTFLHVQIAYYGYLMTGIVIVTLGVRSVFGHESWKVFFRVLGVVVVATLITLGRNADVVTHVLQYTEHSTRGSQSVVARYPELSDPLSKFEGDSGSSGPEDGHSYAYATSWSFPVEEIVSFFVPSYFGYGGASYWGQRQFVSNPNFFGVVILILAGIGVAMFRRDMFVQSMLAVFIISLLLSFGKYFSLLFDIFYNYAPFFNKFRTPAMILILADISVLVLSAYGVRAIFDWQSSLSQDVKAKLSKILYVLLAVSGAIIFLSAGYRDIYLDQIADSDFGKRYIQQYGESYPTVIERLDAQLGFFPKMRNDLIVSLIMLSSLSLAVYLFVTRRLAKVFFQVALFGLIAIDFARVNTRLLDNLVSDRRYRQQNEKTKENMAFYVNFIKQDTSLFRTLPYVSSPSSSWYVGQKIESISGYHPAKLRIYQDLMDVYGGGVTQTPRFLNNQIILDLLNVKYIILDSPANIPSYEVAYTGSKVVMKATKPMPRYWFVDDVKKEGVVNTINAIKEQRFDPRKLAFVEQDFDQIVMPADSTATIDQTFYSAHKTILKTKTRENLFMFIGELYYPVGWKCYIDGKQTKIYKTNYAFRGVVVPEGEHEIKMVYENDAVSLAKPYALALNWLVCIFAFSLAFAGGVKKVQAMKSSNKIS